MRVNHSSLELGSEDKKNEGYLQYYYFSKKLRPKVANGSQDRNLGL